MRSKPATQCIAWRNRMRTQHPNLWHPIRFAIMLIVLAWTIYGVCYEPPTDIFGVIWVAMLVTALVPSPLFLKSTSVAILVIASIGDLFTPYAHLGNSLPAQLYAYGMLAYSTNAIIVATLLTYYVVNILLIDPPWPKYQPRRHGQHVCHGATAWSGVELERKNNAEKLRSGAEQESSAGIGKPRTHCRCHSRCGDGRFVSGDVCSATAYRWQL